MAGDAGLRCLLTELRSVLPSNGGLGHDMQSVFLGAPRVVQIRNKDAEIEKTIKRILHYETLMAQRRLSPTDIIQQVKKRLDDYKKHCQRVATLKDRKKQLNPFSNEIKAQLKIETTNCLKEMQRTKKVLNFSKQDLQARLDRGQISESDRVNIKSAMDDLRETLFEQELELKIVRSAFTGFQSYQNKFDTCEELKVSHTEKNTATAKFKYYRNRIRPLLMKSKRNKAEMTWDETEQLAHFTPLYHRAYAEKTYFQYQYECVQCRVLDGLLLALAQQGGTNEEIMQQEVQKLRQNAREMLTPIYTENKRIRLMKRMHVTSSSSAAANGGTPAEEVPESWDEAYYDDGTDVAVANAESADLEIIDSDADDDGENGNE
jgi:hypothetical protein